MWLVRVYLRLETAKKKLRSLLTNGSNLIQAETRQAEVFKCVVQPFNLRKDVYIPVNECYFICCE